MTRRPGLPHVLRGEMIEEERERDGERGVGGASGEETEAPAAYER